MLFRHRWPCSTRYKFGTGIQHPSLAISPRIFLSACPHIQFHTLPGLLDSRAAMSNSYPNACVPCRETACTIFMMVFGMTRPGREPTTYSIRVGHATTKPTRRGHIHTCIHAYIHTCMHTYIHTVHAYMCGEQNCCLSRMTTLSNFYTYVITNNTFASKGSMTVCYIYMHIACS